MTSILVFSPDEPGALKYRQLLEAALPGAPIGSASTAEEARPFIADAEIIFRWKVPAGLLGQAASLRSKAQPPNGVDRVFSGRAELRDFVSECDFVVSVLPSTEETKNVFDADVFAAMRPDAVFVNIGRGASVDEDALADAITNKRIGGAVLDVFKEEPLPASSLFWGLDRVIITPPVSGPIIPEDVVPFFVEHFRRYRSGERLLKEVDLARGY